MWGSLSVGSMEEEKQQPILDDKGLMFQPVVESEGHDVDFRYYLLAILNRRWMIVTITVLVVVATAVYSFFETPVYRAKSIVDISPPTNYIVLPDSSQSFMYKRDSFINTEYRLLQGRDMAKSVAKRLNLTLRDLRAEKIKKPASREDELSEIASKLVKMIKVTQVPDTNLCEIVILSPTPKLSMTLANAWAQDYVERRLGTVQQYTRKAEELLLEQVKSIQQSIAEKEKELQDYSVEQQVFKLDKSRSMSTEALSSVNAELTQARQERIAAQVKYMAMKTANKESIPEVNQSPGVVQKRNEYFKMQDTYNEKSRLYKPDYPEMIRLRNQLEQFQTTLAPAIDEAYKSVLGAAQTEYQAALVKEHTIEQQLEDAKLKSLDAGKKERPYDRLVMEIENKKQLLSILLQKQNQTDVLADVQEKSTPTSRIIELAELPKEVFTPNVQKNILFSILAGLAGSMALALLLEYFDRSLKTPEDVESHTQLPFLGIVPHYVPNGSNGHNNHSKALAKKESAGEENLLDRYIPYRLSVHDSASSASEALKTVRTSILLSFPGAPPRSMLITSSRAGEGKTFVACNLAVALTQLHKRVVIVDADMRNPHIHKVWNLNNSTGLSIYLTSDVEPSAVTRPGPLDRLFLISSGPKTPRPAELLSSERFLELMKELEKQYDYVILDSPPVLPVTDSVILASRVKSVIMVVRGGSTPRDLVKMAKKKLSKSSGIIAGTVLNGIDLTDPYYYYRYYSDYYSYYGEERPTVDISEQ
jgi:capsular exopolysaccharide synthesis family protein